MRMLVSSLVLLAASSSLAQSLRMPPQGDSLKSTVTQAIGPVTATIEYSSPRVRDRRGKIWGKLVQYGLAELDFNDCKQCPWRAGANENTVFSVSHAVKIQGKDLPAGRYGLHMITGPEEWTVVFSKDSHSWGSYFYKPEQDALRVTVKPVKGEFHEWLTYEFTERQPERATVALKWEDLSVPFTVEVPNAVAYWIDGFREDLRQFAGFDADNFAGAAEFCLRHQQNLPEALVWAQKAVSFSFVGREKFSTLYTLSRAQAANGRTEEAAKTLEKALAHPSANAFDLHIAGRRFEIDGKKQEALRVFQVNAQRFPDQWPVHLGLARGWAGVGQRDKALAEAKLALATAPDTGSRRNLERLIALLEQGKNLP